MRTSDRLLARLREIGLNLPEGAQLIRVYPSPAMRNAGAWSWFAVDRDGIELGIGSAFSMAELLTAPGLIVGRVRGGAAGGYDFGHDIEVEPTADPR